MDRLPLDDQFLILLHKKIMNKHGSARRRAKKYYMDQYRKTGIIPGPLLLAGKGMMEGRKCSGRRRSIDERMKHRFIEMVKASSDPSSQGFIFITQKARTIKNYHRWLEEEFGRSISLSALRRLVKAEGLQRYLHKPDFGEEKPPRHCFKSESVFDLIQIDGCAFRYLKIRDQNGMWQKTQVIEFYDTRSRYMFVLDIYFSETSLNAVDVFEQFLLSTPFPRKKIRLRPDNAAGFLNLKRVIHALNIEYSRPEGFYMEPDFARVRSAKDKAHLESSHRSLHNFEIRIIKAFADRIVKTEPGYLFTNKKKEKITVTFLDIGLHELRQKRIIEAYREEHNTTRHYFAHDGKTKSWIPAQKMAPFLDKTPTFCFDPSHVKAFKKYGFKKTKVTVSKKGTITLNNQKYYVAAGSEHFSRHKGTPVYVSDLNDKLFIFEYKSDGMLIGEALRQKPYEKPSKSTELTFEANEVERITAFLEQQSMVVERAALIEKHRKGLTLAAAEEIFNHNKTRYDGYARKLMQSPKKIGTALFNAFVLDCERHQRRNHVAPYASLWDRRHETERDVHQ